MKGSPVRELVCVLLIFAALAVPLVSLTNREPKPVVHLGHRHVRGGNASNIVAWATLHFAHSPVHVYIHQSDRETWHLDPKGETEFEEEVTLGIHDGFIELIVHVEWPPDTPESVVDLTLEPDGLPAQSASAWGRAKLDTVMVFDW